MKSHYRKRIWKLVMLAVLFAALPQLVFGTALDDYVKKPDANYKYSLVDTIEGKGYTAYVIDMTSQSWRSKKEVDRTLWKHWLTIIQPDKVISDIGLLWINGGSNDNDAPKSADMMLVNIALATGTVVTDLRMVPNQPLNFPDGGRPRYEDAIIAYTFDKCLTTGDKTWPLLLPMVKSAVRAMDTVQKYVGSDAGGGISIKKFVVSGASKRGWTTWLTAAVDKRVAAIAPAVIDVLNMNESMRHHFSAYGFYAPAIQDYQEMKIFDRLLTKKGEAMRKLIDPYEYRSRYTMPKFLVNSTGDQFFLPDSAQFYYDDLPGRKYLRYIPNTDHGLDFSAAASLLLFYKSILADSPLPEFTWKVEGNMIIVKPISGKLKEVNLWQASNEKARDFRVETIGRVWKNSPLKPRDNGRYVARVQEPKEGWTAFFVEMVYDSGGPVPYKFTTQVHVVPERLPFANKFESRSPEKEKKAAKTKKAGVKGYESGKDPISAAKGRFVLKVDLALPQSQIDPTPLTGTLKPGWTPFVATRWADMYMHDAVWEDGTGGDVPPKTAGLDDSGVHVLIDCGGSGNGGFHVYGLYRDNLGGGGKPKGKPKGDPIANGWFHNIDWGGENRGDILMRINGLPNGEYEMTSYHNHWEPGRQSTRNCLDQPSRMPPMTGIRAMPLPAEPLSGYRGWSMGLGTGRGVKSLKETKGIKVTSLTSDSGVGTSVIRFRTDGSNDVLIVFDGGNNKYPDPARSGREGHKAILNAFEIKQIK